MTDVNDAGGAPAPAEGPSAPAPNRTAVPVDAPAPQPQPLGSQTPVDQEKVTLRDTLKQAHEKAVKDGEAREAEKDKGRDKAEKPADQQQDQAAPKPDAKPAPKDDPAKPEQPRGEGGKFASPDPAKAQQPAGEQPPAQQQPGQPSAPHHTAPTRFSEAAKAEWANAPESVRAEAHRAISELTAGVEKYRADAQEYEPIKPYAEMAKQYNTTVPAALANYTMIDRALSQDPIRGLQLVAEHSGFSLREAAAAIMGQTPEQVSSQQDQTINQLRQQIARLEQQFGGVAQNMHQQTLERVNADVSSFAQDHPRFDELADDIQFFLTSDKVDQSLSPKDRLAAAYELAERLNPASAAAPAARTPEAPLNPAADKSVSGAPSAGSDPVRRKGPARPIREILQAELRA